MKYFLIAGETSGDLHASHLMAALKESDPAASFRYYGGDAMMHVAEGCLRHYKEIAYMGFIPVLRHLPTIMKAMRECKSAILEWNPDVVILIDYPGFNLNIAKYIHQQTKIPVYYFILPKAWAWKEGRVEAIREYTDERFSILPFEVPFFEEKHHCKIHYVGNPSMDEVTAFRQIYDKDFKTFCSENQISSRSIIALMPGSRLQEVKDNLQIMVKAAQPYLKEGYQLLLAASTNIPESYYRQILADFPEEEKPTLLWNKTFEILSHAEVALVTSGTATLETALFGVPQVVCYYAPLGKIVRFLKPHFLKVKYISLVNLILNHELVTELIGDEMNPELLRHHLSLILKGGSDRQRMIQGYQEMSQRLGEPGAPKHAAEIMVRMLKKEIGD